MADKLQKSTNDLIDLFKPLNPCHDRLFANKNQRKAMERLVKRFGEEKMVQCLKILPKCVGIPYCPVITTPYQLEEKMGRLIIFFQQLKKMKQIRGGADLSQLK